VNQRNTNLCFGAGGFALGVLIGGAVVRYVFLKHIAEEKKIKDVQPLQLTFGFPDDVELRDAHPVREYDHTPVITDAVVLEEPLVSHEWSGDDGFVKITLKQGDYEDVWDYTEELAIRQLLLPHVPYTIHLDEFRQNQHDAEQITITWYEKDLILADEEDTPMYNWQVTVGEQLNWGHGSTDPDVVYIRNPRLNMEYEVCRDESSYGEKVLGHEVEEEFTRRDLRHSHEAGKFKQE